MLYKSKKNSWTALQSFVEFLLAPCAVVSVSFLDTHNLYYFVNWHKLKKLLKFLYLIINLSKISKFQKSRNIIILQISVLYKIVCETRRSIVLMVTETTQSERKHGERSEHKQQKIFNVNNKFEYCFIA